MQPGEEVPDDLPEGAASPPPAMFTFILWIGAFAAVTWGMMVLFGGRRNVAKAPSDPDDLEPGR